MFQNEPLMFVQGPPVYIKVITKDEESTSVFGTNEEELKIIGEVTGVEQEQPETPELLEKGKIETAINPSIIRRINYLGTPFARQVYRPLQFVIGEERVKGTIEKIDGETLIVEKDEGEKEVVAIEIGTIEEILWRGDPFLEE